MSEKARRYGIALLASGATFGIVALLSRMLPFQPFLLFAVPVALTARYVGRGPTVLTVFLSLVAIDAILVSNGHLIHTDAHMWVHAGVFAIVAFAIDSTTHALHKARLDAERASERLVDVNMELEAQMEEVQTLSEDLSKTNQCLAEARDTAEAASRAREEMLAVVAHDLRNPLNVVMIARGLLAETDVAGDRRDQLLAVMQRATQRMNRLVEDLLEVVRQESGKMSLVLEGVPAANILEETAEMCQSTAIEQGICLEIRETPPDLMGDGRIKGVFFGEGAPPWGSTGSSFRAAVGSLFVTTPEGAEAAFSVADSGPGIAPEDLGHLFEKFWQRRWRRPPRGRPLMADRSRHRGRALGAASGPKTPLGRGSTFLFFSGPDPECFVDPLLGGGAGFPAPAFA